MKPKASRHHKGKTAFYAGCAAEERVAIDYQRRGYRLAHQRWRGAGGEVDLILRDGDGLIFVEVKQSGSLSRAASMLSQRQMQRIYTAAEEFLATEPFGSLTEVRFDVALMDRQGEVQIIENAFGQG